MLKKTQVWGSIGKAMRWGSEEDLTLASPQALCPGTQPLALLRWDAGGGLGGVQEALVVASGSER